MQKIIVYTANNAENETRRLIYRVGDPGVEPGISRTRSERPAIGLVPELLKVRNL